MLSPSLGEEIPSVARGVDGLGYSHSPQQRDFEDTDLLLCSYQGLVARVSARSWLISGEQG